MNSIKLLPLLLLFSVLTQTALGQTVWTGDYFFGEDGGQTAGGSKIYIAHSITITQSEDKLTARISSQGFQTSRDIIAEARAEGDELGLYFQEYGPDHFRAEYDSGALLLKLKPTAEGLKTLWGQFVPVVKEPLRDWEVGFTRDAPPGGLEESTVEWQRIEYVKDEISLAVPGKLLFDGKKTPMRRNALFANLNGVDFVITQRKSQYSFNAKSFKKRSKTNSSTSFRDPYFITSRPLSIEGNQFFKMFWILGPKIFLNVAVTGNTRRLAVLNRFMQHLQIKNSPEEPGPYTGMELRTVKISDLDTSDEIKEALKRKTIERERNISYELKTNLTKAPEPGDYTSKAIVVEQPWPSSLTKAQVSIYVELLADGQIGDMIVYSSASKKTLKRYVEAAKKIKFIPAKRDGKDVDSWMQVVYPVQVIFRF